MSLSTRKKTLLCLLICGLAAGTALAQLGARVPNWTVPPYRTSAAEGGLTTMADISEGSVFIAVTPCRIIDTRFASGTGHGSPALVAGATRTFDMNAGPCTGIPEGVAALSLSIAAILPPSNGFLTAWPTGTAQPLFSQLNYLAGQVIANAAIVPVNSLDQLNFYVNTGPTDIYVDVNGYFMDSGGTLNTNINLQWSGNTSNSFMFVYNTDTTSGSDLLTAAIRGYMSTTQPNVNVVIGQQVAATGANFGVRGHNSSASLASAGVLGTSVGRPSGASLPLFFHTGVRGESTGAGNGLLGSIEDAGNGFAAAGFSFDATGNTVRVGRLGDSGADLGVSYGGGLGGSGTKSFIEPHPTDASKMIRYVSLEGPEAGTYFRGRGRLQNGLAEIAVPESFRMVTDPEGLSIQVTPIGQMASVAVESIGLDRIVVRGSRNVEFFYTVNGVRRAYKDFEVVVANNFFVPDSPSARIPASLSPVERQHLIDNGTYNADGTVNTGTAQRLGWDRVWEERARALPQPEPPTTP